MQSLATYRLGESDELIDLESSAEHRQVSVTMVRQARLSLDMVCRALDPAVYDQSDLVDAVRSLALGHDRARIRVLIQDAAPLVRRGHRLLNLQRRLSSFIEIRAQSPDFKDFGQAYLVVDETAYIYRELADRYEGVASFNDPGQARFYTRGFDRMWEIARVDPNLRALGI